MKLVAVVLALAACHAPAALPPVPGRGGPAWTGIESEHFTVWTDASVEDGAELVRQLEHMRQIVFGVAFPATESHSKSLVIAFRNDEEVHAFVPMQFAATTWSPSNALDEAVIVLDADPASDRHIIAHELTHLISYNVLPVQPHWFAEGLATYFESVVLAADHTAAKVGVPDQNRIRYLHHVGLTPIADLLACDRTACLDQRFYATVSVLFAYLANEHPDELVHYMELISALPRGGQAGAFAQAFPKLPPAVLDHELPHWLAYGKHVVRSYNVALRAAPFRVRPLGDADVLAARGLLRDLSRAQGTPTPPEIVDAIAADPTNVVAQTIRAAHEPVDAATARAVAKAHPTEWRAWALYRKTDLVGPERDEARAKACALLATDPVAVVPFPCPATPSPSGASPPPSP